MSEINELLDLSEQLLASFSGPGGIVTRKLEGVKDFIVKHGVILKVSERYHKYLLFFKKINIKEAIIFECLRRCQIFYTIIRERRKSGK